LASVSLILGFPFKVGMSYTVLWNAFKRITKDLPAEDRTLLFSGTAKKAYQL